jgi:hypothetical protein
MVSSPGCVIAQQLTVPTHPVTVRVFVHDSDGKPVNAAMVTLGFTYYRARRVEGKTVREVTDGHGIATANGVAESEYRVSAEKDGYYRTIAPTCDLDSESGIKKYATGVHEMEIELRPIRHQVVGVSRGLDGLLIPALNKPFGFDLEVGDWVAPHGRGRNADLSFELDGYYKTPDDYSLKLSAVFAKDGDGVQPVSVATEPDLGSAFQLPYEAPLSGYAKTHLWERTHVNKERVMTDEWRGGTVFIFRARTVLDANGNVIRGLYGHLDGNVDFRGTPEKGYKLSFNYWLNPEWTRSLESDPTKTATSVKP